MQISAMEQSSSFMWTRWKAATGGLHRLPPFPTASSAAGAASHGGYSWEEQAFAQDSAGRFGGCVWPPRSYSCSFCKREFRSAQALGGHMNVHRRDRARLKMSPTSGLEGTHLQPNDQVFALVHNDGRMIPRAPHGTAASPLSSSRVSLAFAQKSSGEQMLLSTSTSNSATLVKENSQEHPAAFSVPFSFSDQFSLRLLSSSKQKPGKEKMSLQVKEMVDRGREIRDVGEEGDEVLVEGIRRKRRRINDVEIPYVASTIPCEEDKINIPLQYKVITGTNKPSPADQELDLELRL